MTSLPHRRRFLDTTVTRLESPPRTPSRRHLTTPRVPSSQRGASGPWALTPSDHGPRPAGNLPRPDMFIFYGKRPPRPHPHVLSGQSRPVSASVSASERRSPRGRASHRPPTAGTSAPRLSLPSGCGLHDTENAERPLHSPEAAAAHCTCNEVRAPPGPPRGGPAPWPLPLSPGACPLCWPRGTTAVPSLCPGHPSSTGRRPPTRPHFPPAAPAEGGGVVPREPEEGAQGRSRAQRVRLAGHLRACGRGGEEFGVPGGTLLFTATPAEGASHDFCVYSCLNQVHAQLGLKQRFLSHRGLGNATGLTGRVGGLDLSGNPQQRLLAARHPVSKPPVRWPS